MTKQELRERLVEARNEIMFIQSRLFQMTNDLTEPIPTDINEPDLMQLSLQRTRQLGRELEAMRVRFYTIADNLQKATSLQDGLPTEQTKTNEGQTNDRSGVNDAGKAV